MNKNHIIGLSVAVIVIIGGVLVIKKNRAMAPAVSSEVSVAAKQPITALSTDSLSAPEPTLAPLGSPASVITNSATEITASTATLNAHINPNGSDATYKFEYGTDISLANPVLTPEQTVAAGTLNVKITASVDMLTAGTTYYYRAVSKNKYGTWQGGIMPFETKSLN